MKPLVLFTRGIRDDKTVSMLSIDKEKFVFNVGGSSNIFRFIGNDRFDKALLTLDAAPNSTINTLGCKVLFNQISDFDTHKIALNKVSNLLQQLHGEIICINSPEHIELTRRDSISDLLQNIDGLITPQTIRITPRSPADISTAIKSTSIQLPLLIRECGFHGGTRTLRIDAPDDIERLYALALDGRDYYLTTFHEYFEQEQLPAGSTGINNGKHIDVYKKYRLVIIDGKAYIRHLIISDQWSIHSASRSFMERHQSYRDEEHLALTSFEQKLAPKINHIVNEIYQRIGLDYFGIDCHIKSDGTILLFELNATMNILINNAKTPNIWQQPIETIRLAIIEMIMKRVEAQ